MLESLYPIITAAATAVGTTYLANGEHGPIQTISDLWYLKFGKIHENIKDEKYSREVSRQNSYLIKTAQLTAEEIVKIPEENLQEPRENITQPTMSAIPDYSSEDELRSMFANLLASAMDNRKNGIAHQAFVEIIKNLSPIDAQNLEIIRYQESCPIAEITVTLVSGGSNSIVTNLFLENTEISDFQIQNSSLVNLSRLGLIEFSYEKSFTNKDFYKKFYETQIYKDVKRQTVDADPAHTTFTGLKLTEGVVKTTLLGINFSDSCF